VLKFKHLLPVTRIEVIFSPNFVNHETERQQINHQLFDIVDEKCQYYRKSKQKSFIIILWDSIEVLQCYLSVFSGTQCVKRLQQDYSILIT